MINSIAIASVLTAIAVLMQQLKSLKQQLDALRLVYDQEISRGKTFGDVKQTYLQIKQVEQLLYERKIELKRGGLYKENEGDDE